MTVVERTFPSLWTRVCMGNGSPSQISYRFHTIYRLYIESWGSKRLEKLILIVRKVAVHTNTDGYSFTKVPKIDSLCLSAPNFADRMKCISHICWVHRLNHVRKRITLLTNPSPPVLIQARWCSQAWSEERVVIPSKYIVPREQVWTKTQGGCKIWYCPSFRMSTECWVAQPTDKTRKTSLKILSTYQL